MRTISENIHITQEPSIWERIPAFSSQKNIVNRNEPGAEKTATFGEYSESTASSLVQYIRKHEYEN